MSIETCYFNYQTELFGRFRGLPKLLSGWYGHVYWVFAWLIIMGSTFDGWIYWHFFVITVDYNNSHIELLNSPTVELQFLSDKSRWRISHCFARRLSNEYLSFLLVKVMLRQTVSRPVRLGGKHPDFSFCQLGVCWCGAPSLTRGRVWLLQCTMRNIQRGPKNVLTLW
jgi:hypothetical protein